MISFENDYLEGAHPKVLQRFIDTNYIQASGYGMTNFQNKPLIKFENDSMSQPLFAFYWWYTNKSSCY